MLNQIFAIAMKEIKVLVRDRGSLIALFGLPVAFILVMTVALEGAFGTGSSNKPISLLVSNQDRGALTGQVLEDLRTVEGLRLVETLDGIPVSAVMIDERITAGEYLIGVVFPPDFSDRVLKTDKKTGQNLAPEVSFIVDPTANNQIISPVRGMVEGYVERVVSYTRVEAQTRLGFETIAGYVPEEQKPFFDQFARDLLGEQNKTKATAWVEYRVVSPAQYQIEVYPSSVEQNVPAYTIYGVFFIIQTIAVSFFEEKKSGVFRRLMAAPLGKPAYLIGKGLSYYLVNIVQIVLMFTVGVLVFHLNLGQSILSLVVISLVTSFAATGMGLLLTTLVKSLEQATSLGTMLGVVLSVVGGMMVPVYVMPEFMQTMARFTPHAWALSAYQDVMVRGLDFPQILPELGMLMFFALLFWIAAIGRFKFE